MNPFKVVKDFEAALSEYTKAPYIITTDSCSNALFLCFLYERLHGIKKIELPRKTYIGVLQAALNAGMKVEWIDLDWEGCYAISPTRIIDSARLLTSNMYAEGEFTCLSFQNSKHLSIGKGGAILTDNIDAAEWFRKAKFDGRTEGGDVMKEPIQFPGFHMYLDPPSAARGLWLLSALPKNNKPQEAEYRDLSLL